MANPPNIRLRGNRFSMPPGYVMGRAQGGKGPPQLVRISDMLAGAGLAAAATGGAGVPPVPPPIYAPLVTGETPGPIPIANAAGEFIMVRLS